MASIPGPSPAARRFSELAWQPLSRDYITIKGLAATPDEIAELAVYDADCEKQGKLRFHDTALRETFFALLAEPPRFTVAQNELDFTPYWKRPIPASYYKD